jgi:carbon storage regulator
MLVLSRKNDQAVVIGGPDEFKIIVKVTVLEIRGDKVRLGFEGSVDVPVHREEVWARISAGLARETPEI